MEPIKIKGEIVKILPPQQITEKFSKRQVWISDMDDRYPQTLNIEFFNKAMEYLDNFHTGDIVEISINLKGNRFVNADGEEKCFNTLNGWKIEKINGLSISPQNQHYPPQSPKENKEGREEQPDDLPF